MHEAAAIPASVLRRGPRRSRQQQHPGRRRSAGAACRCSTRRAPTPTPSRSWCWRACCWRHATSGPGLALRPRSRRATIAAIEREVEKGKKKFVGLRAARAHARRRRPRRDRRRGGELGARARHEGARLRSRRSPCSAPGSCRASVEQALSLDDLFARADVITVHVPLNDATSHLVNDARLALLKPGRDPAQLRARRDRGRCGGDRRARRRAAARLRLRLPEQRAQGPPRGRDAAAPRCLDRRGGGELRGHGRRHSCASSSRTATSATASTSPRRCCRGCRARRGSRSPTRNVPNMVGQISTCLAMHASTSPTCSTSRAASTPTP